MGMFDRFPQFLRTRRSLSGKTQEQIAEAVGRGKNYVSKLEHGQQEPKLGDLGKILDELDLDLRGFAEAYLRLESDLRRTGEKPGEAAEAGAGDEVAPGQVRARVESYLATLPEEMRIHGASFEIGPYRVVVFPR